MRLINDSKGCKSWTVTLVVPTALIMVLKFALSGVKIGELVFASVDLTAFGVAFAAVIAPLVARDGWRYMSGNSNSTWSKDPTLPSNPGSDSSRVS
jgi:membrane protein YdbS with pleckstrin-like domain